ncbi:MAG: inositol monophosphatase [Candidatus Levybacteria bacterium]|nr:inositol monophosphatase [Candidatus Levybacteria bacterium]
MSNELRIAIGAAKKGAKEALKWYNKPLEIRLKEDKSVVTIADEQSENAIKQFILSYYPTARFIAEESRGNQKEIECWIIDPIDGTRNFSRGIPLWSVLISLYRKGEFVIGVCYFPVFNWLIFAEKNKGAFCNGKKINVSSISNLRVSYTAFGSPRHFKNKQKIIDLINASGSTRCMDLSYSAYLVASGKMDVLVDAYGKIWDVAPFKVIVEEAGGKLTNLQGNPWTINDEGYIATNGLLHDQIVQLINSQV